MLGFSMGSAFVWVGVSNGTYFSGGIVIHFSTGVEIISRWVYEIYTDIFHSN